MKKTILYLTIAIIAAGCETMYGPKQVSTPVVNSEGIVISVSDVKDSSFVITLSPKGEASYYSYLVDEDDAPVKLDSSLLYSVSYESVAQGTIKWTASQPDSKITLDGLEPNTTYQIYAVAGSVTGIPSSISVASVKTSDKVAPYVIASQYADNAVSVQFCEAVSRVQEKGLTAKYYSSLSNDFSSPAGTIVIDEEQISIENDIVTIAVDGLPGKAMYTIDLPEGAFKDASGNDSKPVTSQLIYAEEQIIPIGIYGQNAEKTFSLKAIEGTAFSDPYTTFATYPADQDVILENGSSQVKATAVYQLSGRTVSNDMIMGTHYLVYNGNMMFALPEVPDFGAKVTVTFPKGAFYDVYGNSSEEFVFSQVLSYGYTADDIIGRYASRFTDQDGQVSVLELMIEESDNQTKGNVKITSLAGFYQLSIYANFNFDTGVLSIPSPAILGIHTMQGIGDLLITLEAYDAESDVMTLKMTESGYLCEPSDDFLLCAYLPDTFEYLGYLAAYVDMECQKIEDGSGSVPGQASTNIGNRTILPGRPDMKR